MLPISPDRTAATLLDAAGLDHVPARSLLPILRGETDAICDIAYSECGHWQALRNG